ncbi:hypothetical protein CEXT_757891 [Caerostris extrusa]|uniref:Uncharacterized protein n=1 Tax=Caerostris extrusa TaxID=172846 RepID=A0AAV4P3Y4_CAEEX|nr:hypothetical protein CEXT_757891 [Caerostris extrusa]
MISSRASRGWPKDGPFAVPSDFNASFFELLRFRVRQLVTEMSEKIKPKVILGHHDIHLTKLILNNDFFYLPRSSTLFIRKCRSLELGNSG